LRPANFERRFAAEVEALRVGDPLDPATQIGPLARADLRETLERQVRESVRMGARVLTGGERAPGRGWYYKADGPGRRHRKTCRLQGRDVRAGRRGAARPGTRTTPCASRTTPRTVLARACGRAT